VGGSFRGLSRVDIYHKGHEKLERGGLDGDFVNLDIRKTGGESERL
jgi:hypothetical protein